MATGGILGNNTKVAFSASSPVSWTRVTQLIDIPELPQLVTDDVDVDTHGPSAIMRSMPGKIPCPEINLILLADPDQATSPSHETLRKYQSASGDALAGTTIWWRIEWPANRQMTAFRSMEFQGFVKEFTGSTPKDDKQTTAVTIRFDGDGIAVYNSGATQIT